MKIKSIFITLLFLVMISSALFASGPKLGTSAAPELMIPMGARNVALGSANIADISGTEAIYWNPAGLSMIKGGEATFSYLSYFADMNISYFAAGTRVGKTGAVGISLQMFSIGEVPVTTIEAPEGTGEILKPNFMTFGASYAKQFTDRINFGANLKVISEKIGNMSASAVAFDFGLQYVTPFNISFGLAMRNFGSDMSYNGTGIEFDTSVPWSNPNATTRKTKLDMGAAELPTSLNMGITYDYRLDRLQTLKVSGVYANNSYAIDQAGVGLEYAFKKMVFLRGGYSLPFYPEDYPEGYKDDGQFGATFGMGLALPMGDSSLMIDYAYRNMDLFDANQYFSIGFSF